MVQIEVSTTFTAGMTIWNQPQQLYILWIIVLTLDSQAAIRPVTNNYFFLDFPDSANSRNKQKVTV